MLISHMPYGIIVLDSENHLVDFNTAAQALPGLPGKLVRQRAASQALSSWWDRLAPLIGPERISQDFMIGKRIFHVTSQALLQSSGWRLGQVFLVEDITQARQAQRQQEQALRSLSMMEQRENLARELHDCLGQSLAAARLQASTAR
jgi:signal transduction histidine kinase